MIEYNLLLYQIGAVFALIDRLPRPLLYSRYAHKADSRDMSSRGASGGDTDGYAARSISTRTRRSRADGRQCGAGDRIRQRAGGELLLQRAGGRGERAGAVAARRRAGARGLCGAGRGGLCDQRGRLPGRRPALLLPVPGHALRLLAILSVAEWAMGRGDAGGEQHGGEAGRHRGLGLGRKPAAPGRCGALRARSPADSHCA